MNELLICMEMQNLLACSYSDWKWGLIFSRKRNIWMNEVIFCKAIIKEEAYVTDLYQDNCKMFMLVFLRSLGRDIVVHKKSV